MNCELCVTPGGPVLWQGARCRVLLVGEPGYPGYCRVIWNAHVAEMSDLDAAERAHCMNVVFAVERVLKTDAEAARALHLLGLERSGEPLVTLTH